jgi:folate-dependent tRNA-U54 methylase TrmFO/GidA
VNFGLFPPLADRRRKGRERNAAMVERARAAMSGWLEGAAEAAFPVR